LLAELLVSSVLASIPGVAFIVDWLGPFQIPVRVIFLIAGSKAKVTKSAILQEGARSTIAGRCFDLSIRFAGRTLATSNVETGTAVRSFSSVDGLELQDVMALD